MSTSQEALSALAKTLPKTMITNEQMVKWAEINERLGQLSWSTDADFCGGTVWSEWVDQDGCTVNESFAPIAAMMERYGDAQVYVESSERETVGNDIVAMQAAFGELLAEVQRLRSALNEIEAK